VNVKRILEMRPQRKLDVNGKNNIPKSWRMYSGLIWLGLCWNFGLSKRRQ